MPWNCANKSFSPTVPPSSKGEAQIVIYVLQSQGVLTVATSREEIRFFHVISGEKRRLPEAVDVGLILF